MGRAVFSALGILLLGLVLLAVRPTPALTWLAVLLGVPATVLLLIQAVTGSDDLWRTPRRSRPSSTSTPPAR